MQLLIHISRRFCNFTRCSQSSGDNEGTIRVVGQGENEGNIGIGSIWEEKQILLLQKLSDYTVVSKNIYRLFVKIISVKTRNLVCYHKKV